MKLVVAVLSLFNVLLVANSEYLSFGRIGALVQGSTITVREKLFPSEPTLNRVTNPADACGDPYAVLDTVGLVQKYGYSVERHNVTTSDGYQLTLFRIFAGPYSPPKDGKPVVFIMHALAASSDAWVKYRPEINLVFLLVDAGCDVWLGNARGNTYCRSHKHLCTADKEFWDFSFHEIGLIDLPCMIDYALKCTGQKTFCYIGYSMGFTASLVLLSEKPEYNDKMILNIGFAPPSVWIEKPCGVVGEIIQYWPEIKTVLDFLGVGDVLPQRTFNGFLSQNLCRDGQSTQCYCVRVLESLAGPFAQPVNATPMAEFFAYYPGGASVKTYTHFEQNINSGEFRKYDYGCDKNLLLYGAEEPPCYKLGNVKVPTALYWGITDCAVPGANVEKLATMLPNVLHCGPVGEECFNHVDFITAVDINNLVNNNVIRYIKEYAKC